MSVIETIPSAGTLELGNKRLAHARRAPQRPLSRNRVRDCRVGAPSLATIFHGNVVLQRSLQTLGDAISAEYGAVRLLPRPVNDTEAGYDCPARVRWSLAQGDLNSYQAAAEFLNFNNIDMVCPQHEYGNVSAGQREAMSCICCDGLKMRGDYPAHRTS
jgi:hypothetical protein